VRRALAAAVLAALAAGAADAQATFPGANGRVAYVSGDGGVWTARPDGSFRRRVIALRGAGDTAWSPDGRRLLVSAGDLFTASADGRRLRRLARTVAWEYSASWSPDMRRVAYLRTERRDHADGLWTMDATGGDRTRLTTARYGSAEWSPDGRWIAYPWPTGGLGVLDLHRGEARRISPVDHGRVDMSWSPDSEWIAFSQHEPPQDYICETCPQPLDILARIRPDGSGYQELSRTREPRLVEPMWSPDGRRLAYCAGVGGSYERWTMRSDGSDRRPAWVSGCNGASWQPRRSAR
jgi:Tol biopolymer transport system component